MSGNDSAKTGHDQLIEPAPGIVRAAITSLVTGNPVLGLADAVARLRVEPVGMGVLIRIDVAGNKPGPNRLTIRVLPTDADHQMLVELMESTTLDASTTLAVVAEGNSDEQVPAIRALRSLARRANTTETADEFISSVLRMDRQTSAQRVLRVLNGTASTINQRRALHAKFRRTWIPRRVDLDNHIRVRPGQPQDAARISSMVDEAVAQWPRPLDLTVESEVDTLQGERLFVVPGLGSPAEDVTRRTVVDELAGYLADTRALGPTAIVGAAGMGKSSLAVRLCHLMADSYQVVGWLSASDATSWRASLTLLSERLGLPEDSPEAVFDALVERGPSLLVVDDAPEPARFATTLPSRSGLDVVVTSQSVRWRSAAQVVELESLQLQEAADYLLARTGAQDEELARTVAETIGGYPLALDQAAAAVVDGLSLKGWLQRYQDKPTRGASKLGEAWAVRIGLLRERHVDALIVLRALSCAGKTAVPAAVFAAIRPELDEELAELCTDTTRRDAAVAELRAQSLIRTGADEETWLVHPLLAELVRDDADCDVGKTALAVGAAAGALIDDFDVDDATQWSRVLGLSSAAVAASRLVLSELEQPAPLLTADLAMDYANHALWLPAAYLHERGAARGAYQVRLLALALHGDKAAAAAVRHWTGDVSDTFTDLDPADVVPAAELGDVSRVERRLSAARWINENSTMLADMSVPIAEAYTRRALEILPRQAKNAHSSESTIPWPARMRIEMLDNLGFLAMLNERHQEATRIYATAVRLQRSFPGGEDEYKHTELLNDQALVLLELGQYVKAGKQFTRAASNAQDHPDPGVVHNIENNIAKTEHLTWQLRSAHERLRHGLDWLLDRQSPHDTGVVIQQCNLGLVAYDLGFTTEGFELVHGTWKTAADRLGEDDRETMIRRMMLAELQVFRGDFPAANEAVLAELRLTPDRPDGTLSVWGALHRVQSAWLTGVAALSPDTARGLVDDLTSAFRGRGTHAALALDLRVAWVLAGSGKDAADDDVRAAALAVRLREASLGSTHPITLLSRARLALLRSDLTGHRRNLRAGGARALLTVLDSLHGPAASGFTADLGRHGQPPVDLTRPGWEADRLMHLLADDVVDLDAGEQLCWQANAGRLAALASAKDASTPLRDAASGSAALYGRFHPWTLMREATAAVIDNEPEQLRTRLIAPLWT